MALYLGSKKVAVTNTVEKQVPSMKAFFEAGGKCSKSTATSFEGCWKFDDTANVTSMKSMFSNCLMLETVPQLDTSNATDMSFMFFSSEKLRTVPQFDTSNVTNMGDMFGACGYLETVPQFDASNVTNMKGMFYRCDYIKQIHMININANLDISYSTRFTREALLEIIGNLKSQTSGSKKLTMGSTNLAKLTDEDKKIATDKGWTLS